MGVFDLAFVSTQRRICWIKPDNGHLGRKREIWANHRRVSLWFTDVPSKEEYNVLWFPTILVHVEKYSNIAILTFFLDYNFALEPEHRLVGLQYKMKKSFTARTYV